MCYFWKIYVINGNFVFYFVFGIIFRDVIEIEFFDISYKVNDVIKLYNVGDIKFFDIFKVEYEGFGMFDVIIIILEGKKGIVFDKDIFVRKGVFMEKIDILRVYDAMDAMDYLVLLLIFEVEDDSDDTDGLKINVVVDDDNV